MSKKILFVPLVLCVLLLSGMAEECFADVSAQLEQADAYVEDKNYEQAEAIYQQIVTDFPDSNDALEAQKNLAILYIDWGNGPQAQAACERLITDFSSHPALPEVLYLVADKYYGLQKHEQAIELFQYIVDTWPESDSALPARMGVAISNIDLGNDAEAEAATDRLIADFAVHPDLPEVLYRLADKYQDSQRHEQAVKLYQYVVDRWPDFIGSRGHVIMADIGLGNDANAQAAIDNLTADFNDHPGLREVLYLVADKYHGRQKHKQAIELYQYIVDRWPESDSALPAQMDVVISNLELGNDAEAEAATDKLIADFAAHPDLPDVLYGVANESQGRQRQEQAIELYQYIVDTWPESDRALPAQMDVVISNLELGNDSEAQAATDKLVTDFAGHPDLPEALNEVANEYQGLQRYEQAIELYQYIVDNRPESDMALPAQMNVVISNLELGKYSEAQAATDKLIADFAVHPDLPDVLYRVANEYQGCQRHEQAVKLYQYVVDRWPDFIGSRGHVIMVDIGLGNDASAQAAIDNLIADFNDHPSLPQVVFVVGEQYYYKAFEDPKRCVKVKSEEHLKKAKDIWERIIVQCPESQSIDLKHAYYFSAVCYRRLREYEKAIEYYQKVVDDWPKYRYAWSAQYLIGNCYERLGKSGIIPQSEANLKIEQAYEAVVEKYPDSGSVTNALLKLGQLNLEKGQQVVAAQFFELFLEMADPSDPRIESVRARLEELGGQNK